MAAEESPLRLSTPRRRGSGLLLIGWGGADWRVIQPLLDAGRMPNLERLVTDGVMGDLASLEPRRPPLLWTSVATGKRADRHGVCGALEPTPDGRGVRLAGSASLGATPLWRIAAERGVASAVVGWPATHPADRTGGIAISDRVPEPVGVDLASWPLPRRSVAPEELRDVVAELRVHPNEIHREQLGYFVPDLPSADPRIAHLADLLSRSATTHAIGTYLAEQPSWDLLAVYERTIDDVCHSFAPYRAPHMDGITDADAARYGLVVDRCYELHDLMLGRYLELVGNDVTVMLLSAYGFHVADGRPRGEAARGDRQAWRRLYGILAVRGPGLKRDEVVVGASLLDVAPTALAVLGLPVPDDMEGQVLERMFASPPRVERIATYESGPGIPATDADDDERLADAPPRAVDEAILERLHDLAVVHLSAGEPARAADLLVEALSRRPHDLRAKLQLVRCRLHVDDVAGARALVCELERAVPGSSAAHVSRGLLHVHLEQWDDALVALRAAGAAAPHLSDVRHHIAVVLLRQQRWSEAEAAFRTALGVDGPSARAHDGLGIALHRQGRYEEAVREFREAILRIYATPLVHYRLGASLAALGRLDDAIESLRTALQWHRDLPEAHESLAGIFRAKGDPEKAAAHLSHAQTLRRRGASTSLA